MNTQVLVTLLTASLMTGLAAATPGLTKPDSKDQLSGKQTQVIPQTQGIGVQRIIVEPVLPKADIQLWLNRGGSNPAYRVGEPIGISVYSNQDAYLYLYSVEANGKINRILPNAYSNSAIRIRAGQTRSFPSNEANFRLTVTPPFGQGQVFAVASSRPLNYDEMASFEKRKSSYSTIETLSNASPWGRTHTGDDDDKPRISRSVLPQSGSNQGIGIQRIVVEPAPQKPSPFYVVDSVFYQIIK